LTNFAEYLEKFPPQEEIEIIEKTSWSCAHGVGRWSSNCGCETGGHPEWNQGWRGPLRKALDWFQCRADSIFVEVGKGLFKEPWDARNRYIDIRINRYDRDTFLAEQCQNSLDESKKVVVLKLLELQSNAMLMYTSCGWFFNDISGIETEQILLYAGKAIQLAEEISGEVLEPHFLELLELAESNVLEKGNGSQIYKNVIEKARMDFQV
jgi:alpha-amylase/alpha-mannosidase (GH57 family)